MKRAEEQAAQIKRRVESADLANSPSVGKIRALAQKIKFFGQKITCFFSQKKLGFCF